MSSVATPDLRVSDRREVDRICERFEHAWRSGRAIAIEDLVRTRRRSGNSVTLLEELIAIEIELLREQGDIPTPDDFLRRFPRCKPKIHELFYGGADGGGAFDSPPGYEVLEELGRGGMGVVYKARDVRLGRTVALKFIHGDVEFIELAKRHFEHEATTIAKLQHAGVVQIYGIDEWQGQPYLILEFIFGAGLNTRLNGKPQSQQWSARLVAQIAETMHYTHQQGVIHRDIKPSNILLKAAPAAAADERNEWASAATIVDDDSTPVVTDFGLAKQLFSTATVSGKGAMLGTPSYMSPEQAEGRSSEVTPASDIYSLGAILYEMLTGRPPVEGETPLETLRNFYRKELKPIQQLRPEVSSELASICHRCLERVPADRYPSASALANALHMHLAVHPSLPPQVSGARVPRRLLRTAIGAGASAIQRLVGRGWNGATTTRRTA